MPAPHVHASYRLAASGGEKSKVHAAISFKRYKSKIGMRPSASGETRAKDACCHQEIQQQKVHAAIPGRHTRGPEYAAKKLIVLQVQKEACSCASSYDAHACT
eukprot:1156608-Pelagomonas_calceolata.AAC.1